jgi:predicted DNA-binding protein (UPF0251 family)
MDTSNRQVRIKIAAGVAGALALAIALGAAGAVAASRVLSTDAESQAVIDDAAEQLGVEPGELSDALKQALENRVDEAVEAGRLTEEQGEELKERIDAGEVPLFGFGRHGLGPGHGRPGYGHFGHFGALETAASYLGLTQAELRSELAEGKTLAEVAEAEGKSVDGLVQAMVAEAEEKIDAAVEDGRLTEEQATELKEGLEERITALVNGELPGKGLWRHGPSRGFGSFGPPAFGGPQA